MSRLRKFTSKYWKCRRPWISICRRTRRMIACILTRTTASPTASSLRPNSRKFRSRHETCLPRRILTKIKSGSSVMSTFRWRSFRSCEKYMRRHWATTTTILRRTSIWQRSSCKSRTTTRPCIATRTVFKRTCWLLRRSDSPFSTRRSGPFSRINSRRRTSTSESSTIAWATLRRPACGTRRHSSEASAWWTINHLRALRASLTGKPYFKLKSHRTRSLNQHAIFQFAMRNLEIDRLR